MRQVVSNTLVEELDFDNKGYVSYEDFLKLYEILKFVEFKVKLLN